MINIFLSYSWNEYAVADAVDKGLRNPRIKVLRDIRDISFRSSIREFMNLIMKVPYVVTLISDAYLKSENCMYEAVEILNSHELEKKIVPLVVQTASHIFSIRGRIQYYQYWKDKAAEYETLYNEHPNEDTLNSKRIVTKINNSIDEFFIRITGLKMMSVDDAAKEMYQSIYTLVGVHKQIYISLSEHTPEFGARYITPNDIVNEFPSEKLDDKVSLRVMFYATQTLSLIVQEHIGQFINLHNAADALIWPEHGITYGGYLRQMVENHKKHLDNRVIQQVLETDLPKGILRSMLRSIETQNESLQQIQTEFSILISQAKG